MQILDPDEFFSRFGTPDTWTPLEDEMDDPSPKEREEKLKKDTRKSIQDHPFAEEQREERELSDQDAKTVATATRMVEIMREHQRDMSGFDLDPIGSRRPEAKMAMIEHLLGVISRLRTHSPEEPVGGGRIKCSRCGKPVSTPVPRETVVRAYIECPECTGQRSEEPVGWQPIETAPKDGTDVLVWLAEQPRKRLSDAVPAKMAVGSFDETDEVWFDASTGEWGDWFDPTHWMPLPEPPIGQPLDGDTP